MEVRYGRLCIPRDPLTWFVVGARRVLLSACTVALVSCGGGQSEPAAPVDSVGPTPAPMPAPGSTQPPPATAQLVVGTAQSIDSGASGNPVNLRVVRSANGDGFAVWRADDGAPATTSGPTATAPPRPRGTARSTSRRAAPTSTTSISRSTPAATRPSCGSSRAVLITGGSVMSARFDAGAGAWAAPVLLGTDPRLRVASDATGATLAVFGAEPFRGHFFDPVSGTWQPQCDPAGHPQQRRHLRRGATAGRHRQCARRLQHDAASHYLASNYFSRSTGSGTSCPPMLSEGFCASVPGSHLRRHQPDSARHHRRRKLPAAWEVRGQVAGRSSSISASRVSRAAPGRGVRRRRWCRATCRTSPVSAPRQRCRRQRAPAVDRERWDAHGAQGASPGPGRLGLCAVRVIDRAVGGGAGRADLGVDPQGNAIAIWQQFEGGRPDDGSRSNIAINRFDRATGTWASAVLAETEPGNAISPQRQRQWRPGAARVDPGRGRRQPRQGAAATTDRHAQSIAAPRVFQRATSRSNVCHRCGRASAKGR